ncbi:carboxylating nicotinate-nucleotide diphosphorylase [Candidatus Acetothermia bacterium]|jgi:nicotinate-nucleotide pyrophosphorylase (carboxylating)|nr:carboxylating nicotinate-nucleotide diphosphorylase [Candidatus Acetothermia bacterium]MCI2431796.1 carboxylating nicotinate-nucleotide diphosphorylase [Candidatus Acetothermia bacterium]MCI2437194.1 carboxylating nicotinate-nucleotide diphosphorylase [Candidatus Acetothermia bacterium]
MLTVNEFILRQIVERALQEDISSGDVTTEALCSPTEQARAVIRAKESCVVAGLPIAEMVFHLLEPQLRSVAKARDGDRVTAQTEIAEIVGSLRAILQGERTALNFLQRLSGIATQTARFVEAVKDFPVQILDTRKTAPGLRILDKYAVRIGGGRNHRLGLYDGVMIKSNHIRACGGLISAIERVRRQAPATVKLEVEVQTLAELEEALRAEVDIIMLDNMSLKEMREAVKMARRSGPLLEASGGVTLENVREIAATGVDFISVGALTHSVRAIDMHLEVLTL